MGDLAERFKVGAILYIPASAVVNASEAHRLYGLDSPAMWVPGRVTACEVTQSSNGRRTKKVIGEWFTGDARSVRKTVTIAITKLTPPAGTKLPEDVRHVPESILRRPTTSDPIGNFYGPRSDTLQAYTVMDYWLLVFPPQGSPTRASHDKPKLKEEQ
jgi:hypothetical protein